MSKPRRYNRTRKPTSAPRTKNGILSDREIDRRIAELARRERAKSLAGARVRAAP